MGKTCIDQGTSNRIINIKCTLNDNQCGFSTRLIKIVDFTLRDGLDNVYSLLGTGPHKMVHAPTLVAGVIQVMVGSITMISCATLTRLGGLSRVPRKW